MLVVFVQINVYSQSLFQYNNTTYGTNNEKYVSFLKAVLFVQYQKHGCYSLKCQCCNEFGSYISWLFSALWFSFIVATVKVNQKANTDIYICSNDNFAARMDYKFVYYIESIRCLALLL